MSSTFPSKTALNPQPPKRLDFVALYEAIGDYVIQHAHSGDPFFERVYECAWKKTFNLNENKAGQGSASHRPAETAQNDPGDLHGI